jgi:hypothetical protein
MGELNSDIVDYIDSIEITTKKETKYIKDNNWTLIELASQREEEFNLHNLLVSRAITHAESLHKIAKEDVANPIVKKMFTALLESFHLHIDRAQNYISSSDWSNYLEKGLSRSDMKGELTFQSDIMKLITELKNKVRKLNIFNEGKTLDLKFHADGIASLIMYNEVLLERHPEIEDYLKKRRETEKK